MVVRVGCGGGDNCGRKRMVVVRVGRGSGDDRGRKRTVVLLTLLNLFLSPHFDLTSLGVVLENF